MQEAGSCAVYVAIAPNNDVVGFYTISPHHLQHNVVSKTGVADDVQGTYTALLLGRMAIDNNYSGKSWRSAGNSRQGPLLLHAAILHAAQLSREVGARLLYVEAKNDRLIDWYSSQGFIPFPSKCNVRQKKLILDLHKVDIE
ncbi:hypothetical protein ACFQY8_02170 [Alloscardovia venturai]|uniref:N-acetyltransferase domain-containing protein n=1 Tax=Alloscardovia venturai TaxID=1769421 RepID=A0ABW2Y2S9_9BIFI